MVRLAKRKLHRALHNDKRKTCKAVWARIGKELLLGKQQVNSHKVFAPRASDYLSLAKLALSLILVTEVRFSSRFSLKFSYSFFATVLWKSA